MKFGDIDYFVHFKDVKKMEIDGKKHHLQINSTLFRRENNNLRF